MLANPAWLKRARWPPGKETKLTEGDHSMSRAHGHRENTEVVKQ